MTLIFIASLIAFLVAYILYGSFLKKRLGIDNRNITPAVSINDGRDFVPTNKFVLLGHHFSSIAGAGPIVGPIIAGIYFGWGPPLLLILIASIFIGGVHDLSALISSVRHGGRSIADITDRYMGRRARTIFLLFIWFALMYVLTVFLNLCARTFSDNGAVATSSIIYIFLGIAFGITVYRMRFNLLYASLLFVPLVFMSIWLGVKFPLNPSIVPSVKGTPTYFYIILLIIYCFTASVLPVWLLLQPRDYLSSFLLYSAVLAGFLGLTLGGFQINHSFYKGFSSDIGPLFPVMFITVACGAISGFHSLISSGTTSKQLAREEDAIFVAYGGMLLEGVVAVIALSTVIIAGSSEVLKRQPIQIFAHGMARFFEVLKLPPELGETFGALAVSAFILTTLDTATRISRYVFEELTNWKTKISPFAGAAVSLILPAILNFTEIKGPSGEVQPAWKAVWPAFGTSNQLLAALALLSVFVWLRAERKKSFFVLIPAIFMIIVATAGLFILIKGYGLSIIGITSIILLAILVYLLYSSFSTKIP